MCTECSSFHVVSGGQLEFTVYRSFNSVSHREEELTIGCGGCLFQLVLSEKKNHHCLVLDYEVRYVDGVFKHSSFMVSARFGYVCCVGKFSHIAKLRDKVFVLQTFNSIWF